MWNIEINENKENNELSSREKLDLLKKEVYQSIAKEFNISHKTAEKLALLKKETWLTWSENLKKEIENNTQIDLNDRDSILSLTWERLQNLYNAISWALKLTNKEYLDEIEVIKIWDNSSLSKKLFPKLYEKAINPEKTSDQIMWFCLWWLDSCSTTIKFLYDIWAWVTLTPHHTYLIITGKWEYKKLDKKLFILAFVISIISFWYIIYSVII